MRRLLREPLVHFLALGALLFAWFTWKGSSGGPTGTRIAITPGHVEQLVSGFTRTWQRAPSEAELKALLDDYVKEEIATREALAMGLDREDTVIRRRLRQKLEFLAEGTTSEVPPTDAEVRAWLAAHPGTFAPEPRVAFRQVFVNASRRGAHARADAEGLLARLRAAGPGARADALGDGTMLPAEVPLSPLREVGRTFGDAFAKALEAVAPDVWTGPIESSYGLHLVLVTAKDAGGQPDLALLRPLVERELLVERRKKDLDALYEKLLAKYEVSIEMPREATTPRPAGTR